MVKLDRLINILSRYGARLHGTTAHRDLELHSVAVHDPIRPHAATGDVFLAVGATDLAHTLTLAADARATVIVTRTTEPLGEHVRHSLEDSGSALLTVDPSVSWSQIASVVYGLVLEGRETESGRGPSDLFALADTISASVDGPVTIEDQLSRVMAYSTAPHNTDPVRSDTILGRRIPEHMRRFFERQGVFAHLATSDAPLHIPPSPEYGLHGRTVSAVRAGRELLGSVWVSCPEPLPPDRAAILREGAHTVALHLLRSRVSADLERQVESELVIELIEGSPDAEAAIGKLGIPPQNLRVIALQAHAAQEHNAGILLAFERATTGFGWSRPGRSTLFGNTVYTLLPAGEDPAPAHRWIADITTGLPAHMDVVAGIGGTAGVHELTASRQEADECMALSAATTRTPHCYDTAWNQVLIQRLKSMAATGRLPARDPIAQLAEADALGGTQYVPTLQAWLEAHGDPTVAARALGVHPNTVRHRMQRMRRFDFLDLDDPAKRTAMLIALSIHVG